MISAISSSGSRSDALASNRMTKIAELTKQVGSLQQQLSKAQETKPAELAGLKANSISQDIASAQSQIEKVVLEAQLAKLSLGNEIDEASAGSSANISATRSENSDGGSENGADAKSSSGSHAAGSDIRVPGENKKNGKNPARNGMDASTVPGTNAYRANTAQGKYVNVQA